MRRGDWLQTASGRAFWPLDPRAEEVYIEDIAHALSNQCRFAGHCRERYCVAEHSVLVSRAVPTELALAGLLHDAAEAYITDIPRPLKRQPAFAEYCEIEMRLAKVIAERFGLEEGVFDRSEIKLADNRVLLAEARDIMAEPPMKWRETGIKPIPEKIRPASPLVAHALFLERFYELTGTPRSYLGTCRAIARTRGSGIWWRRGLNLIRHQLGLE